MPGVSAAVAPPLDAHDAALTLAAFVVALHQPAPSDAPENPFRGVDLQRRAEAVKHRADLALAWMMFESREQQVFRTSAAIDDDTWRRAAGWALNLSLAYLTGDDTTSMPAIGRRTLGAVLAEFG